MNKLFFIALMCLHLEAVAQTYNDYQPMYEPWSKDYILDKIEYREKRVVFYFRFVCTPSYSGVTFYGLEDKDKWVLQNTSNARYMNMIGLKNIRINGVLKMASIGDYEVFYEAVRGDVFTCEVHFPVIPASWGDAKAHLLEGIERRYASNHFHALNIKLKPQNDPNLGEISDMALRIQRFEKKTLGFPKTVIVIPTIKKPTPIPSPLVVKKPAPTTNNAPRLSPPKPPTYPSEWQARI